MSHPFQKPLGWVRRYLYNVEHGPLPGIQLSLGIDHDWPLDLRPIVGTYVTINGTVVTDVLQLTDEQHAILSHLQISTSTAGAGIAVADFVTLAVTFESGESVNPFTAEGNNANFFSLPLVNGVCVRAGSNQIIGAPPVYLPPGALVRIAHVSAVAGLVVTIRGEAVTRPKSYPLRLP